VTALCHLPALSRSACAWCRRPGDPGGATAERCGGWSRRWRRRVGRSISCAVRSRRRAAAVLAAASGRFARLVSPSATISGRRGCRAGGSGSGPPRGRSGPGRLACPTVQVHRVGGHDPHWAARRPGGAGGGGWVVSLRSPVVGGAAQHDDLYRSDTPADLARYARVEDLIAATSPTSSPSRKSSPTRHQPREATRGCSQTAAARRRDRTAQPIDRQPAVAIGGTIHHTALLWRAGSPRSPAPCARWNATTPACGTAPSPPCSTSAVHCCGSLGTPEPLRSALGRAGRQPTPAGPARRRHPRILAGDFNGLGASASLDPDPYTDTDWHPDFAHPLDLNGHVDRRAAIRLERLGRMADCARLAAAEWAPTTGHHLNDRTLTGDRPDLRHPPHPREAVIAHHTADPDLVAQSTDHCPVAVDIDPSRLPRPSA